MPTVSRVTVTSTGYPGAPGISKFSFAALATDADRNAAGSAVRAFYASLGTYFRTTWTFQVSAVVQDFDVQTGVLLAEAAMTTPPAALTGSSAAVAYAGGTGIVMSWSTATIWNGRRIKGRTFLVPMANAADTDGTVTSALITSAQAAAATLIANPACDFVIWARKFSAPPKPIQVDGTLGAVTVGIVPDKTGVLRSRRD